MATDTTDTPDPRLVDARRREMVAEHILFGTIRFLAERNPGLLDELDASIENLWDHERGSARDDEAVRSIARKMLKSLRAES